MRKPKQPDPVSLDEIIDKLTAEAATDDERIWNFQQALQKHIWLPCDGSVIGEPIAVLEFLYGGNLRRAVTARCRRSDGREYEVAVSDVLIPAAIRARNIWLRTASGWDWNRTRLLRSVHERRHWLKLPRHPSI